MNIIQERQEKIIKEFTLLEDDIDMKLEYLIELGSELEDFPPEKQTDENIVEGCQSKVWLWANLHNDNKINFMANSNTLITKGLISLLIRILNHCTPKEIMNADIYFSERITMNRFIGTQRSNGLAAMLKQMKLFALAYKIKEKELNK